MFRMNSREGPSIRAREPETIGHWRENTTRLMEDAWGERRKGVREREEEEEPNIVIEVEHGKRQEEEKTPEYAERPERTCIF